MQRNKFLSFRNISLNKHSGKKQVAVAGSSRRGSRNELQFHTAVRPVI